mgnify:CR=1 FL=1
MIVILWISTTAQAEEINWEVLGGEWRRPVCLHESVAPLDASRSEQLARKIEAELKQQYETSNLKSLAYRKQQPSPEVLPSFMELISLWGLVGERDQSKVSRAKKELTRLAASGFEVCSRILNKFPEVKCHQFLSIRIAPQEFMNLFKTNYLESCAFN